MGGIGAVTDLWDSFLMAAKGATDLLAASLATGHFWLPRTQAEATMSTVLENPDFKSLFMKVEAGPLNEYLTGKKVGPWGFDLTADGLKSPTATFANLFMNQIAILVSIFAILFTFGRCLIVTHCCTD